MERKSHRLLRLGCGLFAMSFAVLSAFAEPSPCRVIVHEKIHYTVCDVDLRRQAVRLFWKRADGEPYGYLTSLPHALGEAAARLLFATNAGMFRPDYRPAGLYVENGHELVRANTNPGLGNFHMKPNGIFYVAGETAGIVEMGAFVKHKPRADFATQSGPMLVINGRLHPRFSRAGGSRKSRNGVGIREPSILAFAIADDAVSFAEFARLFRDKLECDNALFLDGGSVPSLYSPTLHRAGNLLPLGPMIAVFERPGQGSGGR